MFSIFTTCLATERMKDGSNKGMRYEEAHIGVRLFSVKPQDILTVEVSSWVRACLEVSVRRRLFAKCSFCYLVSVLVYPCAFEVVVEEPPMTH